MSLQPLDHGCGSRASGAADQAADSAAFFGGQTSAEVTQVLTLCCDMLCSPKPQVDYCVPGEGTYTLTATLGGHHIRGSPMSLTVFRYALYLSTLFLCSASDESCRTDSLQCAKECRVISRSLR